MRAARIISLARGLLQEYGITKPPVPIERLVRSQGLLVRYEPLESDLSGFLYRPDGVIGVNSRHSPARRRFTLAHELGHFLLHETEELHIDRTVAFRFRDRRASEGTDPIEMQANRFAAEILMPEHLILRDVLDMAPADVAADDPFLTTMAKRYQVSSQAMALRLTNLGMVVQ